MSMQNGHDKKIHFRFLSNISAIKKSKLGYKHFSCFVDEYSSKDLLKSEMCDGFNISFPKQNYFGKQEIKSNPGIAVFSKGKSVDLNYPC